MAERRGGRRYTEKQNQGWWKEEVAKAVGEKREAWKMIECIRDRGEQTPTGLRLLYGQKKKAAMRAVEHGRRTVPKA